MISDALQAALDAATLKGPDALTALAQACREYAREVEATRDRMPVWCENECERCKRSWGVSLPYKRADRFFPETCPPCFNKTSTFGPSDLTDAFRYLP